MYALYYLIIYPIEILLESTYSVLYEYRHNAGMSIIGVSIVINLLLLPLYNRADAISKEEQAKQRSMESWVTHIKKAFKGDERFMMLQTYYRKQGYKPIYSLRSSISLILQIPFFIAAYHFLSNLSTLRGSCFLWLKDLGQPDQLIVFPSVILNLSTGPVPLASFAINVLPLLMTVINIISCFVYTKGSTKKEKIQLCIMALLFLVLLYNSPSGLVIYWTANNVFSLIKNIVCFFHSNKKKTDNNDIETSYSSSDSWSFQYWGGAILLTILIGMVIPSSVIVSSPAEFVTTTAYKDPLQYVFSSLCISAGLFILWCSVFYYLTPQKMKRIWRMVTWILCIVTLVDFFFFGKNLVNLSSELKYDTEPVYSQEQFMINASVLLVLICLGIVLYLRFSSKFLSHVYILCTVCLVCLFSLNVIKTELTMSEMSYLKEKTHCEGFTLSKSGKNVIVIMLDRAIGPYLPYVFTERPELVDKFSGFTYYPNSLSNGYGTAVGSAALFGGYEYSLPEVNKRRNERCVDKHNEALKLMPVIFSEHGYDTTVYDAPLANYSWGDVGDMSIYDPYPDIHAYSLKEQFTEPGSYDFIEKLRKRQFFMYSIYKTLPLVFNSFLYNEGWYLYPDTFDEPDMQFNDNYAILDSLRSLTHITDASENTFMMMDNDITHSPCQLQLPDYIPSVHLNNEGLESGMRVDMAGNMITLDEQYHYHSYMAAFLKLAEWFDYLKEQGVYDNTRIIIASDHGHPLGQFENLILDDGMDAEQLSVLLMCKDFDSEQYNVSFDLMTNADCPQLAMKDLIDDPVNPFTGNPVDDRIKREHDVYICPRPNYGEYTFDTSGQSWYAVHGNIYDKTNWRLIEDPTK